MDFLQTTICEVSGNVSWTGKDDLEPGSVELHHLYPWKNELQSTKKTPCKGKLNETKLMHVKLP